MLTYSGKLWLQVNVPDEAETDAASAAIMQTGTKVGEIARSLYPDGLLIDTSSPSIALAMTQKALSEASRPLFEAAFAVDSVLVYVDLLLPAQGGWVLGEVKSSTTVKEYHYEDAAVQTWVLQNAGVKIVRSELIHINNQFVYQGDGVYTGLFTYADISQDIAPLQGEVGDWIKAAQQTLTAAEPEIAMGDQCSAPFECPFQNHCRTAAGIADDGPFPPEILPYAKTLATSLRSDGYSDIRDVPVNFLKNPIHQRIQASSMTGQPYVDPALKPIMRNLPYPRYYLDFETINPAIPIWANTRPYQMVPFQWSCHTEDASGNLEHLEYLADGEADPRPAFIDTLVAAVGSTGPVLVYNAPFESGRMKELAEAFPDKAVPLQSIISRVVDLLPLMRDHYYHPDMLGSWSIKTVLPTVAPELDYTSLPVGDGGMAMEAFAEILDPTTSNERRRELRTNLLEYCHLDTLAMVKLVQFFS